MGMYGAQVVLYMSQGLGFEPGVLGMIWAVGGLSSFVGALLAPYATRRLGTGRAMAGGLAFFALSMLMIPLARGATIFSALLLLLQQLGDGFYVVYQVNQVSLQQAVTDERLLGRVTASMQVLALGGGLAGALLGGWLGELAGVRSVLLAGGCGTLLAALGLGLSPLGHYRGQKS